MGGSSSPQFQEPLEDPRGEVPTVKKGKDSIILFFYISTFLYNLEQKFREMDGWMDFKIT